MTELIDNLEISDSDNDDQRFMLRAVELAQLAESFDEIVKKYSLEELMTQCTVMCISKKIEICLKSIGWKTLVFSPGEELNKIDQIKNG